MRGSMNFIEFTTPPPKSDLSADESTEFKWPIMKRSMNFIEFNTRPPTPPTSDVSDDGSPGFNWPDLSTELKELVVAHCVRQPLEPGDEYNQQLRRYHHRFARRPGQPRGIYTIIDKLTDWAALLGVSHQVRAITLRMCFAGSSEILDNGFHIYVARLSHLQDTRDELGSFYAMVEADSLPKDTETQALAHCYKHHPKIYSHLHRYATFWHGLRCITLGLRWHDTMRFFKVIPGGDISYDIFDQLPHLKEIAVKLPQKPQHRGWSNVRLPMPMLFHEDYPCPRILHRLIYERIVDVLRVFSAVVKISGFVDQEEEVRWESLCHGRKWTKEYYAELYEECGGGIQLEEAIQPGFWASEAALVEEEVVDDIYPPECKCAEKCHTLL